MKKRRPVLGVLFAVVAAVLFVRSCGAVGVDSSAAFIAHAAYTGNTVTLTQAQTLALFGQTIDCTYYAAGQNGQVVETDAQFTYLRNDTIQYETLYSENGQTFAGRQMISYQLNTTDLTVRPTGATVKLKTSIDLSGVQYLDTGICEWLSNLTTGTAMNWYIPSPLSDTLYGAYNDYWHTSETTFLPLRRGASGTPEYNYYGAVRSSATYNAGSIIPCYLNSDSLTAFSFGYANLNWAAYTAPNYSGRVVISIVCPILSDNWQYSGSQGAGDYDPNSSSGGGSDGGADMSGVESRLDTIIAQLDAIYAEMQDDDESSGGGSDSVASLDSTPDDYNFEAAFAAAEPDFHVPTWIVAPESSGSSSPAVPDFSTPATTQASAPSISDVDIGSGASGVWGILSHILGAAPWFAPVAMFSLALSIAGYFLFRGGGN